MSSDAPSLTLDCRAKINLALAVGAPDPETGMHPIASWMTLVNFADRLELTRCAQGESQFERAVHEEVPDGRIAIDWPLEKDLAYRAHQALQAHTGRALPVRAALHKRIPAGAGLAGGSSNAAAMLVGLHRLFELDVTDQTLIELGLALGSDVGFMVRAMLGAPAALVTGFGERIAPLPVADLVPLVLIFPPFGCPTGAVYRAFDAQDKHEPRDMAGAVQAIRALAGKVPLGQADPFNDLAEAACEVQPQLRELRDMLVDRLDLPVHITGSGSTMFVIAPSAMTAKVLARKITAVSDLPAVATRTA